MIGTEKAPSQAVRCPNFVARDTLHALRIVSTVERLGPKAELSYRPSTWPPTPEIGVEL
jgi:D-glycero-D-manno-heptose 1,7-bisphosphate phosphatase